jgi:hypothetical protein
MTVNSDNPIGSPWWLTVSGSNNDWTDDYTRSRSGLQYSSPDKLIGRKDYYKYTLTTNDPTTVSGKDAKVLR